MLSHACYSAETKQKLVHQHVVASSKAALCMSASFKSSATYCYLQSLHASCNWLGQVDCIHVLISAPYGLPIMAWCQAKLARVAQVCKSRGFGAVSDLLASECVVVAHSRAQCADKLFCSLAWDQWHRGLDSYRTGTVSSKTYLWSPCTSYDSMAKAFMTSMFMLACSTWAWTHPKHFSLVYM